MEILNWIGIGLALAIYAVLAFAPALIDGIDPALFRDSE